VLVPCHEDILGVWRYTSTPSYVFMAWYFVNHRDASFMSQCSSVSIVTRLQVERLGFDSLQGQGRDFSLQHDVQTSSGAHPPSYPMGTGGPYALYALIDTYIFQLSSFTFIFNPAFLPPIMLGSKSVYV
jgi:hypothetical protein